MDWRAEYEAMRAERNLLIQENQALRQQLNERNTSIAETGTARTVEQRLVIQEESLKALEARHSRLMGYAASAIRQEQIARQLDDLAERHEALVNLVSRLETAKE